VQVSFVDAQIMNQLSYEVCCRKFTALGFACKGDLNGRIAESVALLRGVRRWS
jgi:hypothetical protein